MNPEKLDKLITATGDLKPSMVAIESPRLLMTGKTITNPDGSKDYVATCVSSNIAEGMRDGEIKGVVLKGGRLEDVPPDLRKEILESEFAGDETYALPADKGVVVQVIPDDQLPTDAEGNKAELLIPERRLSGLDGDFDYDMLYAFPPHAVIPVYAKPKTHINRQRQGYSRRKAKRAYQARAAHQVKLTRYKHRGRGYLLLLDDNGNPVNLKSDIHIGQAMGRVGAEVDSFTQPTKPTPHGKGDING
ncbi:hypothetical protein pEaSNUABM37_00263 [Erwinia phage pEa_SNUABM_37]|nr:hypothetical protein pEaSNUABM37_00263 [Erwinia phage pEa_SNUABM_37]QXO10731.1 hypothetical protein pEaSNUABM48_00263 [Erwinia phage pEa_SNUABM_48]